MPKSSVPYGARICAHSGVGHKKVGPLSQAGLALLFSTRRCGDLCRRGQEATPHPGSGMYFSLACLSPTLGLFLLWSDVAGCE